MISSDFNLIFRRIWTSSIVQECDGVSALAVGVPFPGLAVFDADAIHLFGGVVTAAHPPDSVAQVLQQIRQVGGLGDLRLRIRET